MTTDRRRVFALGVSAFVAGFATLDPVSHLPSLPQSVAQAAEAEAPQAAAVDDTAYVDKLVAQAMELLAGTKPDYTLAARILDEASKAGSPDAMLALAVLYRDGNGVAKDYAAAERFLLQARDNGRAEGASAALGDLYQTAEPPFRDTAKAIVAYQAAIDLGNSGAMINLARVLAAGDGTAPDFARARDLLEAAIKKGAGLPGLPMLGDLYRDASGGDRDLAKAADAYQKAAYLGDPWSMISLARLVAAGEGVPLDVDRAARLLDSAIAVGGNSAPDAWNTLGDLYHNAAPEKRDPVKAVAAYEEGARLGSPWSTISLATMLGMGDGVPPEFARAVKLLNASVAAGGDTTKWALGTLGDLYRGGDADFRNPAKAVEAYEKAIVLGNAPAMINLGRMYLAGEGIPADFAKGSGLLKDAIAAGAGKDAGLILGDAYRNAPTVEQRDYTAAVAAYRTAADLGNPWAMIALAQMEGNGEGTAKDFAGAVALLDDTIGLGGDTAKYAWGTLGDLYRSGAGADQNFAKAVAAYDKAVALGNPSAMIALARMYQGGDGVTASFDKARTLLESAVTAGAGKDAGLILGDLYRDAPPANRDAAKAVSAYETAAGLGNPWAMVALGRVLGTGAGVPADFDRATELLDKAIALGGESAKWAWRSTGDIYLAGDPAHRDPAKAVDAYGEAIAIGDTPAMVALARMFSSGDGVKPNFDEAVKLLNQAIAAGGGQDAGFALGDVYRYGAIEKRDAVKALAAYEVAADLGNSWAMIAVGQMLGTGEGVPRDFTKAAAVLQKTADLGGDTAKVALGTLGDLYRKGDAADRDPTKAQKAYEAAIALGNSGAMISLAEMYGDGEGIPADFDKARLLLEKAIGAGAGDAGLVLGDLYMKDGVGRPDPVKALASYEIAAARGNGYAHLAAGRLQSANYADAATRTAMIDHFKEAARTLGPDEVSKVMFGLKTTALYSTVQDLLTQAGQRPGATDGVFGPRMQQAIDGFCAARKIGPCARSIITLELLAGLLTATG